jgi:hypothetical protein
MVTFFVGDLDFEIKLDVHQRLAYYNHEFQANKQHGKGYTSKTKVKSDLDKSIAHSSGNDGFDWHHALQFHIGESLQSSLLHDLRTVDASIHMNIHCHS